MSTPNQKKRKPMSNDIPAANKRKKIGWESLDEYLEENNMQDASPALKEFLARHMDFEFYKIANRTFERSQRMHKMLHEQDKKIAELSKGFAENRRLCQQVGEQLVDLNNENAARRKELDSIRVGVNELQAGINDLRANRLRNERSVRDLQSVFIPTGDIYNYYN